MAEPLHRPPVVPGTARGDGERLLVPRAPAAGGAAAAAIVAAAVARRPAAQEQRPHQQRARTYAQEGARLEEGREGGRGIQVVEKAYLLRILITKVFLEQFYIIRTMSLTYLGWYMKKGTSGLLCC